MYVEALIPDTYVRNENMKLDLYKRIAALSSEEEAQDMRDELEDRFGKIPKGTENLIQIALLRTRAHSLFIENMKVAEDEINMAIYMSATIDPTRIAPMLESFNGRMRFVTTGKPVFIYSLTPKEREMEDKMDLVSSVLEGMEMLVH